mgnify:CR=1 FL=1
MLQFAVVIGVVPVEAGVFGFENIADVSASAEHCGGDVVFRVGD